MTISEKHKAVLQETHAKSPYWGDGTAVEKLKYYTPYINSRMCDTVLNYGSSYLDTNKLAIPMKDWSPYVKEVINYDPAIPGIDVEPTKSADFVLMLDVLEHVEPDHLDSTLKSLQGLMKKGGMISVAVKLTNRVLTDGSPAVKNIQDHDWWEAKISEYFAIDKEVMRTGAHYMCIVSPK